MSDSDRTKEIRLMLLRLDLEGNKDCLGDNHTTVLPADALNCSVETYLQICHLVRGHSDLVHTLNRQVYPDMTDEELVDIWVRAKMKRTHES